MTLLVFTEQGFRSLVLLGNHLVNLNVNGLGCLLAVWAVERVLLVVVIAEVRQSLAHAGVSYHCVCLFGDTLKVVHGTGRYLADECLLGCTAAKNSAHLIKHLLLGGYLTLLGHVPCRAQCAATRNDGYLDERVRVLKEP